MLAVRIPRGEEFLFTPSHCMVCGHRLRWYENIPLVSWCLQKGKCRACRAPIPVMYPAVEALNALLWLAVGLVYRGETLMIALYCALCSALIVIVRRSGSRTV